MSAWLKRAGEQAKRVHQHLVLGQARDLGQVQADEIRVKMQAGIAWMAMAIAVAWRLWLGGVLSASPDKNLIAALAALVRACTLLRPLHHPQAGTRLGWVHELCQLLSPSLPRCGPYRRPSSSCALALPLPGASR